MEASTSTSAPKPFVPRSGKPSNQARNAANNFKYGTPLPLLLPCSQLYPRTPLPPQSLISFLKSPAPLEVLNPLCKGIYDARTRSVWVTEKVDRMILFERGFFGKGSLSRSDPSWWKRRVKVLQGGNVITSEEITAKRRVERKQFKIARAHAILDASVAADNLITGISTSSPSPLVRSLSNDSVSTTTTAAATSKPLDSDIYALPEGVTRLTPQTFLTRPTRPAGQGPTRGKRPKRKPPVAKPDGSAAADVGQVEKAVTPSTSSPSTAAPGVSSVEKVEAVVTPRKSRQPAPMVEVEEDVDAMLGEVDREHLQLSMEEALFLCWGLGCLEIRDGESDQIFTPHTFFRLLISLSPTSPPLSLASLSTPAFRPDHPFLISYAAYHHFRSLGWVVKTGIKFCCDWLLYKRGMVFSHAEFATLVIPQYMDKEDETTCPYELANKQPLSWQWVNTVNRVNTQVKKTLILVYVTIPPMASLTPADFKDPEQLFKKYSVREVTLRRFSPARMRD